MKEDGHMLGQKKGRFSSSSQLPDLVMSVINALTREEKADVVCLALEKNHHNKIPIAELTAFLGDSTQLLTVPAMAGILLGAIPSDPGILISMGAELRLAVTDSTLTYREFRISEGGGLWWTKELFQIAENSPRIKARLQPFVGKKPDTLLPHLPQILAMGGYPGPDPVLKLRVEQIAEKVAQSCLGLSTRLPGLSRLTLAGFLHPTSMSQKILDGVADEDPDFKLLIPTFPAEIGAALFGLAFTLENREREHLQKPNLASDIDPKEWEPNSHLLRRLYRTRKPFEVYQNR